MKIRTLAMTLLLLAANLTTQAKDIAYTSSWHDRETVEMASDATLKSTASSAPRIRLTVAAQVDFANDGFTFGDGSVVEIRNGGTLEINHNVTFGNNCRIYAEDGAIVISKGKTLTTGQGTTLYLHHHGVQGDGTLLGDFAQIDAPMTEVFAPTVNVAGRWLNDRVYPQWFGAVAYPSLAAASASGSVCSARAIESAAAMAQGAEVFVPRGYYSISRPIHLSAGINICGTTGHETRGSVLVSKFDYKALSDRLKATDGFGESYKRGNYLIEINIKGSDSKGNDPNKIESGEKYCTRESYIKNLRLVNSSFPKEAFEGTDNGIQIYLMYGILSGAPLTVDGVTFQHFGQALRFTDDYIDNKCVTNCTMSEFWNPEKLHQDNSHKAYAFNMGFLGDAVTFTHNGISGDANKGLLLNFCGGANISNNIITAECLIRSSKGVDVSSNHFEIGTPLKIENSTVTMRSNYFWLADNPVVQIYGTDGSIVSMDGDVFRFYDSSYYMGQSCFNDTMTKNDADNTYYNIHADIAVDKNSKLNLSNVYRYWEGKNFDSVKATGIIVCEYIDGKKFGNIINEFSRFSYALSRSSQIASGLKVNMQFEESDLTKPFSPKAYGMLNDNVAWVSGSTGTFSYQCQLLLDSERHIGWTDESTGLQKLTIWDGKGFVDSVTVGERFNTSVVNGNGTNPNSQSATKGVLIIVPTKYGILRVVRTDESDGSRKYVDIPICGTQHLYDNGISICGYSWRNYKPSDEIVLNEGVEDVEFNGTKAKLYVRQTALEHLTPSDVVYVIKDKFIPAN